jgi:uncharacterized protein (DUF58 family)
MLLAYPHEVWLMGLLTLGGVWLISYWWAKGLAQGLHLTRQIRFGWAQVGDRLEEQFTLVNQSRWPALWVEVLDQSTLPDYQPGRVTGVSGQGVNRWKTEGVCTRRGVFTLGPTLLRSGDPFGLYTVTVHQPDSTTLTVTPPVVPLPTIEVAPGGRAGEGRPQPNALERTVDAATVRPYHPGDARQAIHWPTSARREALFVRRFETTPAGDWWLVLDVDEQVQVGQGANSTLEHGVILAASLADRGLRAGRGVGLLAYGQTLTWLPPKQADAQRWQILRALATVTPGSHPLAELLAQPSFGRLASLIIITPNTGSGWIGRLPTLLRAKAVATVLLLDPLAFGGTADPQLVEFN